MIGIAGRGEVQPLFLLLLCFARARAGDVDLDRGLIARWRHDGATSSFDGRSSVVRVADSDALHLGTRDFTIAARINAPKDLGDVVGDMVTKFDARMRRGITLAVVTNAAATSAQANCRQLQFGIDGGKLAPAWTDCGRPGKAMYICALAVHEGNLFAGTCEPCADESGHVYRYDAGTKWIDCGSPDRSNAVISLASFDGALHAATAKYRLRGSSLPDSPNQTPGGKVFRHEGGTRWTDCGKLGDSEAANCLAVYRGKLHASSLYSPGVFRYEGGERWADCGTPNGRRVEALAPFNGWLYGTGYDAAEIYRYEPQSGWQVAASLPDSTQTYGFAVYQGRLHTGTWPSGRVYREESDGRWASTGRLGEEKEVMGMAVYNGKLYAGTLPRAEVYRYDGDGAWTRTGQLDSTPGVTYRRAWSMAVYRGKLYCGTLPSGRVYSLEAGKCVTHDFELESGIRHIAAVRGDGRLSVYVDGKLAARSEPFDAADHDVTNAEPLLIGAGQHDHFAGSIHDVRLYGRALTDAEIRALQSER